MAVVCRFSNFSPILATSGSCWVYDTDYLTVFQTVLPPAITDTPTINYWYAALITDRGIEKRYIC